VVGSGDTSPDRKRRKSNGEQQLKRHKYDVVKAFFRIFFQVEKESMVLKDAIYNLYARKIPPDSRIARNAMYRHMWSYVLFKDKISVLQSNYREYIKGIKILTSERRPHYDAFENDLQLLRSIGLVDIFDFQEEELQNNDKPSNFAASPSVAIDSVGSRGVDPNAESSLMEQHRGSLVCGRSAYFDSLSILSDLEQLEAVANHLVDSLQHLKAMVKKKFS